MSYSADVLTLAKCLHNELTLLDVSEPQKPSAVVLYDEVVTNKSLRKKTEKLFKDGHHARSVEEAYKVLDNLVKKKAGLTETDLTGSSLMQTVFSPKKPILKLNEGASVSEQNEQSGYMQILAGCMTGIRNPRAHEADWEDTEQHALQLLALANHLVERVFLAEKAI